MSAPRVDPTAQIVEVRGLSLNSWEWPATSRPARADVVFVHATGFHARLWDPVIRRLPASWRCLALDVRGHGLSQEAPDGYAWSAMVADTAAVADALELHGAIGVGHSMGGFVIAGAAVLGQRDYRFGALLLVDPTINDGQRATRRPRIPTAEPAAESTPNLAASAKRRRPTWSSPQAMYDSFRSRPPFDTWEPEALRAYCDFGLIAQDGAGGMRLACPPEVEAATFAATLDSDPWPGLARLAMPAVVMRGTADRGLRSVTSPKVADAIPHGIDAPVPASNHFIPMERPDLVADEIGRLARRLGLPT